MPEEYKSPENQVSIAGGDITAAGRDVIQTRSFNASIFIGIGLFFVSLSVLGGVALALYTGLNQTNQNPTEQEINIPTE